MNKFRASYSNLHRWESGDFEGFVKGYFKLEPPLTSREQAEGKEWHDKWKDEVLKTSCMPELFGGRPLVDPIVEIKKVVQLEDWLDYVFIADLVEGSNIHDWKTGVDDSGKWINTNQLGCYAVGLTFDKIFVNQGFMHHYNQYTKRVDSSSIWLTDQVLKEAHNWIITLSCEAHEYLRVNNLYEKYGK
ncbi:MAG: hypothetical protein WA019_03510 [Candidatus Moraniibacteriota bacterium]